MGLAYQCDSCKTFMLADEDMIFIFKNENCSINDYCLACITLMYNEKKTKGTGKFDVNKVSLFDYPAYRSSD